MSDIVRVEKCKDYTVMKNVHFRDQRLSLKAIGLLSKMLSLPDDWDYTVAGLAQICRDGKASIATAIQELEQCGYIERHRIRDENGCIRGIEYIVREVPVELPPEEQPETENRLLVEPTPEGSLKTDFPELENPALENRSQLNTNKLSTKYNKPPIVPLKGSGKGEKRKGKLTAWKPEEFERFWQTYPLGADKEAARRAWDKLKPDDELIAHIMLRLQLQLDEDDMWADGIGIPYASTWLNQKRWTREPVKKRPVKRTADDSGGDEEWWD